MVAARSLSELPSLADDSADARWALLTNVLEARRWDPVVFDLSPPQFRRTALMKVVMPELSGPFPPSSPGLGHPRYYHTPADAGHRDRPLEWEDLRHEPLPYP